MKRFLSIAIITVSTIVLISLGFYLFTKRDNILNSFYVFDGQTQSIDPKEKDLLENKIISLNTANKLMADKWESSDMILLDSFGYIEKLWKFEKPITSTIEKSSHTWITGNIEMGIIKGADYEFTLDSVYENYGEILPKEFPFTKLDVKAGSQTYYLTDDISKKCEKGICSYGTVYAYKNGSDNFCASTQLNSNQVCFISYIAFSDKKGKHLGNGSFTCSGKDSLNVCDRIFKSVQLYEVSK